MNKEARRERLDLLLVNPGGREKIYQELGADLSAVEPPLWCRLIGGYARDRGVVVDILDSEALNLDKDAVAKLNAAGDILQKNVADLEVLYGGDFWNDWLLAKVLHDEARTLLLAPSD